MFLWLLQDRSTTTATFYVEREAFDIKKNVLCLFVHICFDKLPWTFSYKYKLQSVCQVLNECFQHLALLNSHKGAKLDKNLVELIFSPTSYP